MRCVRPNGCLSSCPEEWNVCVFFPLLLLFRIYSQTIWLHSMNIKILTNFSIVFFSPYCPIILQTDTSNRKVTNSARPAHKPKATHQTYQSNQMEVKRWSNERINSRRFLRFLNFVWCWNFGIGLNAEQFMDIVFVLFGLFTFFSFYFWCYFEIMKKMVLQHIPQHWQIKILFVSS